MSLPILLHPIEKTIHIMPTLPGIYLAQPYGKLCYAWFTDSCTLIERSSKKQWTVPVKFDPCLSGTIVSGTFLSDKNCFVMDNLFHYKNDIVNCPYLEKINKLKQMLTMHIRTPFFFLPEFSTTSSYKMYSIKIIYDDITYQYIPKKNMFQLKSTPKSDIYEIHKDKTISIACIDTYQCSAFMNKLFHPTDTFIEKTLTLECTWNEPFKKWTPKVPV